MKTQSFRIQDNMVSRFRRFLSRQAKPAGGAHYIMQGQLEIGGLKLGGGGWLLHCARVAEGGVVTLTPPGEVAERYDRPEHPENPEGLNWFRLVDIEETQNITRVMRWDGVIERLNSLVCECGRDQAGHWQILGYRTKRAGETDQDWSEAEYREEAKKFLD